MHWDISNEKDVNPYQFQIRICQFEIECSDLILSHAYFYYLLFFFQFIAYLIII